MNFEAVYHKAADNYCYPYNNDELIINLKTGYDVVQVFIHYGDPFSAGILGGSEEWEGTREEIPFKKYLKNHIWWTTTVKPEFKRCKYYFELITEDDDYYFFENDFIKKEDYTRLKSSKQAFIFPWMNPTDINRTPKWVNDAIWYQIFPERFCNGDPSINAKDVLPWAPPNRKVKNAEKYGGDLRGIINKLDYLKELGITALYLTPINKAETTHKYDTTDYYQIDPEFGDKETMKEFVNEAHDRGIRVMLDGVFNHCGEKFAPWLDVVEKGPKSRYYDWFFVNKWPFDKNGKNAHKGNYLSFAFADYMPKLNTNNPEVRNYLLDVCEYWVQEYDIDAIRLDVANEISHRFCKELNTRMGYLKDDFYILGEIWHDSMPWLRGDEFDAVMNYPLTEAISDFWVEESLTKEDIMYAINKCYTMYMQQTNDVLFNLLDSHDTIRLSSKINNIDKVYQQLAVLYTMPGSPCIYYGTEVGLEGFHDPDCRRCMPWAEIESGKYDDRIELVKDLIKLRHENPLFKSKHFHFTNMYDEERLLEYIKIDDYGNKIMVLLNCEDRDIEINTDSEIIFSHLFKDGVLKKNGILIHKLEE